MERTKITNWEELMKTVRILKKKNKALLLYAHTSSSLDKLTNPELFFALVDATDSTPICDRLSMLCKMEGLK